MAEHRRMRAVIHHLEQQHPLEPLRAALRRQMRRLRYLTSKIEG